MASTPTTARCPHRSDQCLKKRMPSHWWSDLPHVYSSRQVEQPAATRRRPFLSSRPCEEGLFFCARCSVSSCLGVFCKSLIFNKIFSLIESLQLCRPLKLNKLSICSSLQVHLHAARVHAISFPRVHNDELQNFDS